MAANETMNPADSAQIPGGMRSRTGGKNGLDAGGDDTAAREAKWRMTRRKCIDLLVGAIGLAIFFYTMDDVKVGVAIPAWVVVEALYCVLVVWRNRLLLLVHGVMAYAIYSVSFANYFNPIPSVFASNAGSVEALLAMRVLLLFEALVVMMLPSKVEPYGQGANAFRCKEGRVAVPLVVVLILVLLAIGVFGYSRPGELGSDRGKPTAAYEYAIILFIVGLYLAKGCRGLVAVIMTVLVLYAGQVLVFGGRVVAIQLLIVAFFFVVSEKMTRGQLITCCLVIVILFLAYGRVRTAIWHEGLDGMAQALGYHLNRGLAWDTAYSAWYTSITFITYSDMISPDEHARLLASWLQSLVLGSSAVPDSSLPHITQQYVMHYGGGFLPEYAFFYLGYPGVFLSALPIALATKLIADERFRDTTYGVFGTAGKLTLLYVVATTPRWFLYSPSQITRGMIICFLACCVLIWLSGLMTARGKTSRAKHAKRAAA